MKSIEKSRARAAEQASSIDNILKYLLFYHFLIRGFILLIEQITYNFFEWQYIQCDRNKTERFE